MHKFFATINKVDDEQRIVSGYATTEALDVQGEIVTKDAISNALQDYMKFANVREMHAPSAVGVTKSATIDDKGLYIDCKIVDDVAWNKVKEGVYKGFSIGGNAINKKDGVINALTLTEISLVDRPANPEALIELWKMDKSSDLAPISEMINKGLITADQIVKLADAEVKKSNYEGEEVFDVQVAAEALSAIYNLYMKESGEKDEKTPEQISALNTAIQAIKDFIALEIKEDFMLSEKAANNKDICKAGRKISSENMAKMQDMHDKLVKMGVSCGVTEKGELDMDIAKFNNLEEQVQKINLENERLKKEIEELKKQPAEPKGFLKSVTIGKNEDANLLNEDKIAPVLDHKGETNEVATLIKGILMGKKV